MSDLVKSFATERLTISRFKPGKWVRGRFEKGKEKKLVIDASVQPLTPNEIVQLPEHRRNKETLKIYTCDRLFTSDESSTEPADVIRHDGKDYEIHKVSNWNIGTDLPHFKVIAVLIDGEGDGGRER